jgi:hypothetical protein
MIISNAKYYLDVSDTSLTDHITATVNGKVWDVPIDASNAFYAEIMRQVAAGELTIADAD